jgi:ankyrin repeat protein
MRAVIIDEIAQAVGRDDEVGLKLLLDSFPQFVNSRWLGKTPLHRAADKPTPKLMELLLARGADVGAVEDSAAGFTPLHEAAAAGQRVNAERLITAGAVIAQPNALGLTAEQVARDAGFISVADWLQGKTS